LGQSLYSLIHPDDVEKLREQLSTTDSHNTSRILDLKTGTVKKEGNQSNMRLCMGSRRGFIIRMHLGDLPIDPLSSSHTVRVRHRSTLGPSADGQHYAIVHVTGYIRNWPPTSSQADRIGSAIGGGDIEETPPISSSHCCLVAIGRLQVTSCPNTSDLMSPSGATEFISRHSIDGKFTFVDHRVTTMLGYQPQELLGKSVYDFYHPDDQIQMKETFEQVLKLKGQAVSVMYRFCAKSHDWVWLRTSCLSFQNPYTEEVEYIVCTNSCAKQSSAVAEVVADQSDGLATASYAASCESGGGSLAPLRAESASCYSDIYANMLTQSHQQQQQQQVGQADTYNCYGQSSIIKYQGSYSSQGVGGGTSGGSSSLVTPNSNMTASQQPCWTRGTGYGRQSADYVAPADTSSAYNQTSPGSNATSAGSGYAALASTAVQYDTRGSVWQNDWVGVSNNDGAAVQRGPGVRGHCQTDPGHHSLGVATGAVAQSREPFVEMIGALGAGHSSAEFGDLASMFTGFIE
jgi:PAS domain S-box-containing protein